MNDIRTDLKAYVDGELSPERMQEVETAIARDPALREEVEFMKMLGFQIQRIKFDPPVQGAEQAIAAARRRPRFSRRLLTWGGAGFGVLFLLVVWPVFAQSKRAAMETAATASVAKSDYQFADSVDGDQGLARKQETDTGTLPADGFNGRASRIPQHAASGKLKGAQAGEGGFAGGVQPNEGIADPTLRKAIPDYAGTPGTTDQAKVPTAPPMSTNSSQRLIRTADLALRVDSAKEAQSSAIRIVTGFGGFIASSNLTGSKDSLPTATVTLRVPVRSFDNALESLRKLGDVVSDTSNTDDVTAQVADTDARLKVMRAEEDSYVTMLRAAKRVGELLEIKERLSTVRQEIESLDAQKKALADQSTYSTISATFEQKPKPGQPEAPKGWADETWANAVNGLGGVGRFLASAGIFLFVYSPIWLPIVIIGWIAVRRGRKGA